MNAATMEAVIGVEVHAQLLTNSKLFCSCSAATGNPSNSSTCPVCLGHPGALPVLNGRAVEMAAALALACGCRVEPASAFARKHYFYPDLPKGYQITQYESPLAVDGGLEIEGDDGGVRRVGIERIHLEEDAGKLLHDDPSGNTLVDFNRAGVPLAELVSRPDLRSPGETVRLLAGIKQIVEYLGICDGRMEEGSLRCDVNVSLRPAGSTELGSKTELKNLNSFRAVGLAIGEEIRRQREIIAGGGRVADETRSWDPATGRTVPLRSKEEAPDYRYFPEPDLPPVLVGTALLDEVRNGLPELPGPRRRRLIETHGLAPETAGVICSSKALADYFEAGAVDCGHPAALAHWVTGPLLHALKQGPAEVEDCPLSPARLAELSDRVEDGSLTRPAARDLFPEMFRSGESVDQAGQRLGIGGPADEAAVARAADDVLRQHPEAVDDYRRGKTTILTYLVGQVMAATRGTADPQRAAALLEKRLAKLPPLILLVLIMLIALLTPAMARAGTDPHDPGRTPGYFIHRATDHFQLHAPTRHKAALEVLTGHVEPILADISGDLGIALHGPVRVIILTSRQDVEQLNFRLPSTPEWSVGYAIPGRRIVVLKTAYLRGTVHQDVLATFRHELVHILVRDATGAYAALVPRWFNEGLAMIHTRAWGLRDVVNISKHLITRKPIPLSELEHGFPQGSSAAGAAYAQSTLFMTHLRKEYGREAPGLMLRRMGTGTDFEEAFRQVTGSPLHSVEAAWRRSLTWRYRWIPVLTSGGTVWGGITLLFIVGAYRKWRRNRELLELWEEEEEGRFF
jgi:aspartyl-tRNA(Asn)/glutamyl-tRNA(Gln) amidotransferase subunit B